MAIYLRSDAAYKRKRPLKISAYSFRSSEPRGVLKRENQRRKAKGQAQAANDPVKCLATVNASTNKVLLHIILASTYFPE